MPLEFKILIILDDSFLSDLYKIELTKSGFKVIQAFDGLDGLAKCALEKPSLILLNLDLPELSGTEVLEKLKSDVVVSSIPVVVLGELSTDPRIKKSLKLGAAGYSVKRKLTPKQVVNEVKKYLLLRPQL